tara:strand:- start:173 stop:352 length:180 start_codon:yes stop_codon:yes gene_type:complete
MFYMSTKNKPQYTQSITVKVTPQVKRNLEKMAWDNGDGVSRIIRKALSKTYPEACRNGS